MNIQVNKIPLIIVCGATAVVTIAFWIKYRKTKQLKPIKKSLSKKDLIREPDIDIINDREKELQRKVDKTEVLLQIIPKEWKKIGEVKELFIYPLKSGRGKLLKESIFTYYGMSTTINDGHLSLRDRMFLVYKQETGEFRAGKNYPTLVLITLSAVNETHVKLEAVGMPSLTFEVPKNTTESNLTPIPCLLWWGEMLECVDCGSEVARWISRFLTGTNNDLRLCCVLENKDKINNVEEEPWEKFDNSYTTLRDKSTGLSSDLASYVVMSESSVYELNHRLDRPGPALQFRPNMVVAGPEPFAEDNWEWIKIGEKVVIRNVKPYTKEQRNLQRIKISGEAPTAGIYCGLYLTGNVKIGDEVFVNGVTVKSTSSGNPKFASELLLHQEATAST